MRATPPTLAVDGALPRAGRRLGPLSSSAALWLGAFLALYGLSGCSDEPPQAPGSDGGGGYTGGFGTDAGSGASDAGGSTLPPEKEKDFEFGSPESSASFVFIPVKGTDDVVKVSGATLKVSLIEVGDRPTVLRAVPGQDAVAVINSGSDDVSVLRATESADEVSAEPVVPHCNAMGIGEDGGHAVVWYDHAQAAKGDPVGNFQAVSVVDLAKGGQPSLSVSVGFKPSSLHFVNQGKRAMLVTEDGISVLDFATLKAGAIIPAVPLSPSALEKPIGREVQITPDGTWAVVRQQGTSGLRIIHIASKTLVQVPLDSMPTDVDLLPDGSAAIAVLRESKQVARVALPQQVTKTLAAETVKMEGFIAGLAQVTDDGKTALLYTTVMGIEEVAILDTATLEMKPVLIRKTVDFVFIPKGSRKAVMVHRPGKGPGADDNPTEAFVDSSQGYTFIDLDTGFTKLVLTPVKATDIALTDKPAKLFMLLPDPKGVTHAVHEASIDTFLSKDFALGSKPEHIRYLPGAKMVAVTQDHPSGRLTFIHVETGAAKTVTGYELNSLVK